MTDFEAIGRYDVALTSARDKINQRNQTLQRLAIVAGNVQPAEICAGVIGKRYNIAAMQRLLDEAAALDAELQVLMAQLVDLAALAGKPAVRLA